MTNNNFHSDNPRRPSNRKNKELFKKITFEKENGETEEFLFSHGDIKLLYNLCFRLRHSKLNMPWPQSEIEKYKDKIPDQKNDQAREEARVVKNYLVDF